VVDIEKVIKGLGIHSDRSDKTDCDDCPYSKDDFSKGGCIGQLCSDALALLKEQPEIVRCKDCKYWSAERINDFNKCRRWINVGVKNFATMGEWFCADGEREEGR